MRTRSQSRNQNRPQQQAPPVVVEPFNLEEPFDNPPVVNMAANGAGGAGPPPAGGGGLPVPDLRTMEELCQPSLDGRGGPIAPIAIQATTFGLKNDMIQQVQNSCPFRGPGDDANKHLDKFLHVTQSMKVNGVSDDALRLHLFPYSLQDRAAEWFDRLPRNSINSFDQMAKIFLGKYFPPSMVTKLRNDITNFRQRPDESLFEAWERYKLSIDRCPNHNMLPVTQIDTFYNGLTLRHRDTINAAAGGTFMKRRPEECYDLIENMTAHHNDWDTSAQRNESSSSITSSNPEIASLKLQMEEMNRNLTRMLQTNQQVNSVTPSCKTVVFSFLTRLSVTVGGQTQNVYAVGAYNQGGNSYQPQGNCNLLGYRFGNTINLDPPGFNLHINISLADALILIPKYQKMLKSLLSNKEKLIELANTPVSENCLAVILKKLLEKLGDPGKFLIPCDFSELKCQALSDLGASINLMPLSVWKENCKRCLCSGWKVYILADFVIVDYESDPHVPLILGRPFLRTAHALIDVHGEEMILRDGNERLILNMRNDTSSYSNEPHQESINMIDIYNVSHEKILKDLFSTNHPSGNPTSSLTSHTDLTSPEVNDDIFDPEEDIIENLLNLNKTKNLPPYHDNQLSGNPTLISELETKSSSPTLISLKESKLIWEEFEAYLASDSFPPGNSNPSSLLPHFHNSLSGSTTSSSPSLHISETSDYFLEEFADEIDHITFPPGNDDLSFDAESDLLELENLLNHDPIKEMDSILEDSVDETSLDDNLTVNDDTYDDPFDFKEEKIKDSKILIDELDSPESITNCATMEKNVKKTTNASFILEDFNPPLYELPFHKEVPGLGALLSFSFENEEKVFNPGILTSKRVHTSFLLELSHRGTKAFKVTEIFKSPMEIFPCSYQKDIRVLDVP
ncbi:reverse transcriptase domain-containing protein [Tanacetum coccineum]|uniref:Reverse transcriptase domain-containing protein n=1 Tax=Tanacetum coccineum TaxID=301880 RepID=A0ABQ5I0Y1_9ASTR